MRLAECESSDDTTVSVADSSEESSISGSITIIEGEDNVYEERLRVDRRKLEQMLQATESSETEESAEDFFHRIMEESQTIITWPSKLKVGGKSKKDPHIKITGQPESVLIAREKVLESLDTKRNRVTLKMDISFTDHSHIIGKGGHNIQQVMVETGCHIHFPDSNRNSVGEKSNQVSIAGQPYGVEKAKCQIRELLPMVVTFELPMTNYPQPVPDVSSPPLQLIQQTYCFTISIRPNPRGGPITVIVRGCRRQLSQLRQGLVILMGYLTKNSGSILPVSMSIEIAPQHHAFVMGRSNSNIINISRETGASIVFPDPAAFAFGNSNLQLRKSTVVISGYFDSVCMAWQDLMGYLPLVLLFDLKEGQDVDTVLVTNLMNHFNLNIVIRPKPKQNTKSIMVRGSERDYGMLFEVRKRLLDLENLDLQEQSPRYLSHTFVPAQVRSNLCLSKPSLGELEKPLNAETLKDLAAFSQGSPLQMTEPYAQQMPNMPEIGPTTSGNNPILPWIISQISTNPAGFYGALLQAQIGYAAQQQQQFNDMTLMGILTKALKESPCGPSPLEQASSCTTCSSGPASSLSSPNSSPCESPVFMSSENGSNSLSYANNGNLSSYSCSSVSDSSIPEKGKTNWQSNFWSREKPDFVNLASPGPYEEDNWTNKKEYKAIGRPIVSTSAIGPKKSPQVVSKHFTESDIGTVGCERSWSVCDEDYQQKRLLASKVVSKPPVSSAARVPTDIWSGCGFSKSMPQQALHSKLMASGVMPKRMDTLPEIQSGSASNFHDNTWKTEIDPEFNSKVSTGAEGGKNVFSCSNYLENMLPRPALGLNSDIKDLTHLFLLLSLEKYLEVFRQQQVDLPTFLTLTEQDLQELNIPYSSRRKMILAITELKALEDKGVMRNFQAAPGAERRSLQRQNQLCSTSSISSTGW